LIGAGALAESHLRLFASRLPSLEKVTVYDTHGGAATRFCDRVAAEGFDLKIEVAPSAREAVDRADIAIPVTTTTTPYLELNWLTAPTVVVNVSLDDATAELLLSASPLLVDDWNLVRSDRRRLLGRLAADGMVVGPGEPLNGAARAVDAELGSVLHNSAQLSPWSNGVAVINPFGLSIEDVALAGAVYDVAIERDWGLALPR
jgi:ornithine cyclodeaminase/alanine dehydrogenase-like protein (mu-crystallin family)